MRIMSSMSIKLFQTRQSLKNNLRTRNLHFKEQNMDTVLKSHNYFNFFNGLETIYLKSTSPKHYENVKLDDFMNLYSFDKEICCILSSYLDTVEEKLKASISYHFASIHCVTLQDTMQYTNPDNYMNPANNNPGTPTYCRYSSAYPFANFQNKKIYNGFYKYRLFLSFFLTNLINGYDHIDASFYQDASYCAPSNVAIYKDSSNVFHRDIAVPFWVAIETLTFGEILWLLNYLQDDVMEKVLLDFNLPLSKRAQFLNMIDILLCLRNSCAHTTLINRFRTPKKYHLNSLLISSFSLNPKNADSVLSLYDTVKILNYFTDIKTLAKPFQKLKIQTYRSFGIRKGKETYKKILARMGCNSYNEWKILFKGIKYSL